MSVQENRLQCLDRALRLEEIMQASRGERGAASIVEDAKTFEAYINEDVARGQVK